MRPRLVLLIALLAFLAPAGLLAQTYGVSVTPQGGTAPNTPIWSTGNSYLFRVQNEGSAQDTWTLTCQGAGSVTVASCPSSITLAGNTFQRVTVTFSTGNEGTGTLYLTASSSNSSDQGWVTVPVVVPAGAPRMAVLPYLDAKQDLGRCAVSCFAATYAQGTVPYFSLETPRNVTLVYHGDRLKPRPFVAVDVWPDTTFGGWPSEYQLQVKMDGSSLVTFLNGEQTLHFTGSSGSTRYRLAGQFDASSYSNGTVHPMEILVTAVIGGSSYTNRWLTQFLAVDATKSPIAKGWTLAGVQRLFAGLNSGKLITEGDGSATYFKFNTITSSFDTPAGDFSTLKTVGSTWVRAYPDSTKMTFNSSGLMVKVADRWGSRDTLLYDGSNRLTSIKDPLNNAITLAYGANGLSTITDPFGRVTTLTVQADSSLTAIKDPDNVSTTFGYDVQKRLQTLTDRTGKTTTLAYQVRDTSNTNKLASITGPNVPIYGGTTANPATTLSPWQTVGVPYSTTNGSPAPLAQVDTVYARVTEPGGAVSRFTVNRWGTPAVTTDALGRTTTVTFTVAGQPAKVVAPGYGPGIADTMAYNGSGLVTYRKAAGATATTIVYGGWAQPTDISGPGQASIHYTLGANGGVSAVAVGGATRQQLTYDGFGRVVTVRDGSGVTLQTNGYFTTGTHQNLNWVTLPGGRGSTYTYDGKGRQTTASPVGGVMLQTTYYNDSTNAVDSVKSGLGSDVRITRFKYDKLGRDTTVTDAMGQVYKASYNALGWVINQVDPAGAKDTFQYTVDGDLKRQTNRRGQNIDFGYDPIHRPLSQTGSTPLTWSYPSDTSVVAVSPTATDSTWTSLGSLATQVTAKTVLNSQSYIRKYYHSGGGQLDSVRVTGPAGVTFTPRDYVYDTPKGLLTDIKLNGAATHFTVDGNFNVTTISLPGGMFVGQQLGSLWRPVKDTTESANNPAFERWMGINDLGQIDRHQMWFNGIGRWFEYDYLGQLKKGRRMRRNPEAGLPSGCPTSDYGMSGSCTPEPDYVALDSTMFTYDAVGNRTDNGGTYTTGNRITAFGACSYATDADGNVTSRSGGSCPGAASFFWTAEGQLDSVQVTATGTGIKYSYDAAGRLVQKRVNGNSSSYFLWDGDNLLAELNGTATALVAERSEYPGLDQPQAVIKGGIQYYARRDGLGSVLGLTDTLQVVQASYDYDDWGHLTASGDNASFNGSDRARWKGALWQGPEVELYYMRNRWYDPSTGRFLSEDPIGLAGGINPSVFAGNDPVDRADPDGLCIEGAGQCLPDLVTGGIPIGFGYWWASVTTLRYFSAPRWGDLVRQPGGGSTGGMAVASATPAGKKLAPDGDKCSIGEIARSAALDLLTFGVGRKLEALAKAGATLGALARDAATFAGSRRRVNAVGQAVRYVAYSSSGAANAVGHEWLKTAHAAEAGAGLQLWDMAEAGAALLPLPVPGASTVVRVLRCLSQ